MKDVKRTFIGQEKPLRLRVLLKRLKETGTRPRHPDVAALWEVETRAARRAGR